MDWRAIEQMTDLIIGNAFGESVRHSPIKNGVADASRPLQDIKAILHHPSVDGAVSLGNGMITTISASQHALVIDRSLYPGIVIKSGDRVRANARSGTPWFEVKSVSDRHSGVLIITLNEA